MPKPSQVPQGGRVDFKKVNMRSSTTFFSDAMLYSLYVHQPPLKEMKGGSLKTGHMASKGKSMRFRGRFR